MTAVSMPEVIRQLEAEIKRLRGERDLAVEMLKSATKEYDELLAMLKRNRMLPALSECLK